MLVKEWRASSQMVRVNTLVFAGFLLICLVFGGASRGDALSQIVVRLASVVMIGFAVVAGHWSAARRPGVPLILALLLAALVALQLVPLPPSMWASLPGHAPFDGVSVPELAGKWRPLSLTPDFTLNSLLALLPLLATLMGGALVERRHLPMLLVFVIFPLIALGGFIGLLQISGNLTPFYRISNADSAVGLFANRNHQAALLACGLPLVAAWLGSMSGEHPFFRWRYGVAAGAGIVALALLLVSGSRGGLAFGFVALLASVLLLYVSRPRRRGSEKGGGRLDWRIVAVGVAGIVLLIVVFSLSARDQSIQRMFSNGEGEELRLRFLPVYLRMAQDFLPLGSGFGSFSSLFLQYEPFAALRPSYLNHAHNDVLELLIEGGIPALLLLLAFILWFCRAGLRMLRSPRAAGVFAKGAAIAVTILMAWSFVDYPLRTPALMALASFCIVVIERFCRETVGPQ